VASFKNVGCLYTYGEVSCLTHQYNEFGSTSSLKMATKINQVPSGKEVNRYEATQIYV